MHTELPQHWTSCPLFITLEAPGCQGLREAQTLHFPRTTQSKHTDGQTAHSTVLPSLSRQTGTQIPARFLNKPTPNKKQGVGKPHSRMHMQNILEGSVAVRVTACTFAIVLNLQMASYLPIYRYVCQSSIYHLYLLSLISVYQSTYLSLYLPIYVSLYHLSFYLSIYHRCITNLSTAVHTYLTRSIYLPQRQTHVQQSNSEFLLVLWYQKQVFIVRSYATNIS